MTQEHMKKLIENNLDYAELLLVPSPSDLELIDKDAGLGNISLRQHSLINAWFNSLHKVQQYTKPVKILIKEIVDNNNQTHQIPINPKVLTKEQIAKGLATKEFSWVTRELPRYPMAFQDLKSRISSMLITSGSIMGFKAELQHSSINRTKQEQTLEEINPAKDKKKWGRKK